MLAAHRGGIQAAKDNEYRNRFIFLPQILQVSPLHNPPADALMQVKLAHQCHSPVAFCLPRLAARRQRQILPIGGIMFEEIDIADHTDQLSVVHDGHSAELVETQQFSDLM